MAFRWSFYTVEVVTVCLSFFRLCGEAFSHPRAL
jgi:hypothetical protein